MNLKKTLLIAASLSLVSLGTWELHCRWRGYKPLLEDDKYLWATQRAKVENASRNDVVLLGSSRVLFDIQLDEWEKKTGTRPIQLASAGASPLPAFRDVVQKTNFAGTVLVGVTPGLFFSSTHPEAPPLARTFNRINFYHSRTYAQQLNFWISIPLEKSLAFLCRDEEEWADDLNLKKLISNIRIGNRIGEPEIPPFYRFAEIDLDRNVRMSERTATDTAFANTVKRVWKFYSAYDKMTDREATTAYFLEDVKKFISRGGNLILLRCPSEGMYKEIEDEFQPRKTHWDELLKSSGSKGYYYEDYPQLAGFHQPEWSHLSATDARLFTRELVSIMQADGALSNAKSN